MDEAVLRCRNITAPQLVSNGDETLTVFTNTTTETLTVPGSAVTMEPNTVLLELLNVNGRYVTIMGRIDANEPDALSQN